MSTQAVLQVIAPRYLCEAVAAAQVWSQMDQRGVEPSPACTNAYVQALVQQVRPADLSLAASALHLTHSLMTVCALLAAFLVSILSLGMLRVAFTAQATWYGRLQL